MRQNDHLAGMLAPLPSQSTCFCGRPAVTALLVGRASLAVCREDAQRLIDGDFLYSASAPLELRRPPLSNVGEGPVAVPVRAVH